MRVQSQVSIAHLHHFRMNGCDTFRENADGTITLFKLEECDRCGAECEGANPVILEKKCFVKKHHKSLLLVTGFEPRNDVTDELGATDEGDAVCPACYSADVKERESAAEVE